MLKRRGDTKSAPSKGSLADSNRRAFEDRSGGPNSTGAHRYLILSSGAFAGALLLLAVLIRWLPRIVKSGMQGSVFYLVLVSMGLAVAAFLFGSLRSYARYRGNQFGGAVELGGPIVGWALVVTLGLTYGRPQPTSFDFTVFVQGERGPSDQPLRAKGDIWLQLGQERRHEAIDAKGQALFRQLPGHLLGNVAMIWAEYPGFQTLYPSTPVPLDGGIITVIVGRPAKILRGTVRDEQDAVVVGASVQLLSGPSVTTDVRGNFEILVPGEMAATELELMASASGFTSYHKRFPLGEHPVYLLLKRIP